MIGFRSAWAVAADSQFGVSTYETVFLNGTFAWSPDLYTNIPNGGLHILWVRRVCNWRLRL